MFRKYLAITILLAVPAAIAASENITNYSSPVSVNAFFQWNDTLWAATSGGLRIHDLRTGGAALVSNSRIFPDLHLTSITRDSRGNMWMGSRKGYLYRRTPRGQFTAYSNYRLADWSIVSLYSFDGLIIVGSNRGVSVFDPEKGVALRNATNIADFANPRVNAIFSSVMGDTLFLGCDEGVAYLDSLRIVPLAQRNFYYPGIWKTKRVGRVLSFVQTADSVMAARTPAAVFRDYVFTAADTGWVTVGGQRWVKLPISGVVTALHNEGDRRLWFGTEDAFYFSFDGEELPVQHRMDGMTLRQATRVMVDEGGDAWFLPSVPLQNRMWHHGVYRFDGKNWHRYNDFTHEYQFGYIGDGPALGIAQGLNGTIWTGMWGGNLKHIDPVENTVAQLCVGDRAFRNFSYVVNGFGDVVWGKSDAVATDKNGYLWIAVFDSDHGSLICYDQRYHPNSALESDPVRARYRRFFTEPPLKTTNIALLNVDADNRIFAYDAPQARLTVFRYEGNPLADGIVVDTVYTGIGMVSAIETGEDGTTYVAGTGGLRKIAAGSLEMEMTDNSLTNVTSIAAWGNVLWLGTNTRGVLRYDFVSGEIRPIDESSGMPSNNVLSVAVDRRAGRLWAVTDEGVSQIDIGRSAAAARRAGLRAFPNVFSISGGGQGAPHVTFAGLDPQSSVSVYTVNGALVAKVDARHFTDHEWRAVWTPRRNLSPGTYIATVKPSGKRTKIILRP